MSKKTYNKPKRRSAINMHHWSNKRPPPSPNGTNYSKRDANRFMPAQMVDED